MVGVAPNGVVTYLSKLYPGSTSDKQVVAHCGILTKLEASDLVLADKDFLIGDLLPPGVALNIPPFLTTAHHSPASYSDKNTSQGTDTLLTRNQKNEGI